MVTERWTDRRTLIVSIARLRRSRAVRDPQRRGHKCDYIVGFVEYAASKRTSSGIRPHGVKAQSKTSLQGSSMASQVWGS